MYYRSGLAGSLSRQKSLEAAESAFLSLILGAEHLLAVHDNEQIEGACANMLQTFEFEFYPAHAELRRKMRDRILELGGGTLEPPGPPAFHTLRRWVGWRAARSVQYLAERLGLNQAARGGRI